MATKLEVIGSVLEHIGCVDGDVRTRLTSYTSDASPWAVIVSSSILYSIQE